MTHPVLRAQDLRRTYGTRAALRGVSFDVRRGERVALLGASPGASTAVWIMVHMLENCFHKQLVGHWVPKLKEMIPSYGHNLKEDAALCARVRAETAEVLKLQVA